MESDPLSEYPQLYSASQNAPLENLAPELRRNILSILTLETLKALVHASPVYHQQYRYDRRFLLTKCLNRTFYGYRVDACAALVTGAESWLKNRTVETVRQLLKVYGEGLSTAQYSIQVSDKWKLDDIVSLAAFHLSIVKPFASGFTSWALEHLARETGNRAALRPLRWVEEARVMRALYRVQIHSNLFFRARCKDYSEIEAPTFDPTDILREYFCLFEPWEVEEIVCIIEYFAKENTKLMIRADFIVRLCGWSRLEFENMKLGTHLLLHLAGVYIPSSGLELLHAMFFRDRYYEPITVSLGDGGNMYYFIPELVGMENLRGQYQEELRWEYTEVPEGQEDKISVRYWKEDNKVNLKFQGDEVLDTTGVYPPFAWTSVWYDVYSNLYANQWCHALRRWGYVMWDEARIKLSGSQTLIDEYHNDDW